MPGFLPQINNAQQKIITRNLTVKDNNNHITCTQVFLDNRPWKNPRGKTSAADLEIFIIQQENIEISYNKIGPAKIPRKTSAYHLLNRCMTLLQIPLNQIVPEDTLREPLRNRTTACMGTASPSTDSQICRI
jgi:hypothetical protein